MPKSISWLPWLPLFVLHVSCPTVRVLPHVVPYTRMPTTPAALNGTTTAIIEHPLADWVLGHTEFLPITLLARDMLPASVFGACMEKAFLHLFGWPCSHFGPWMHRCAIYSHIFSPSSMTNFRHWFQVIQRGQFEHFQRSPRRARVLQSAHARESASIPAHLAEMQLDSIVHDSRPLLTPKGGWWAGTPVVQHERFGIKYPTQHITTPLLLLAGTRDTISPLPVLQAHFPRATTTLVTFEGYHHLDFLWASDLPDRCFPHILRALGKVLPASGCAFAAPHVPYLPVPSEDEGMISTPSAGRAA
jgi:lysosomal acid lipase/cholesteryl ester hydrolase